MPRRSPTAGSHSARAAILAGVALALAAGTGALACAGADLTLPGEGVPTTITVVRGDGQTARVGAALTDSLAVRVTDGSGRAVAGVLLRWEATGGAVSPESGRTDSTGYAAARRVLGDTAGSYPTRVMVDETPGIRASFSAVATPDPQTRLALALATQPAATAHAGERLGRQPEVQLRDEDGRDVARSGIAVTAAVETGQGSLQGTTTRTTDAQGLARFNDLAIGGATGDHTLIFAAAGIASVRSATIAVSPAEIPRTPTRIAVRAGDDQEAEVGSSVAVPPSVIVTDAAARPVAGAEVTFTVTEGGGRVSGARQTTGSVGVATVDEWTLGSAPGKNTLVATVAGVTAGAAFDATARAKPAPPPPAAKGLAFKTQPSDAKRRSAITPPVQVRVVDDHGTLVPVDGVRITIVLARGADDGTLLGTTEAVTVDGVATFALAVDGTGKFSLRATAQGLESATSKEFEVRR